MKNVLVSLPRPFLVLAPMDDVTETVFRRVVQNCAPADLMFTEFVNVDALCSAGRTAALRRLRYEKSEKPLIAQIWGKTPDNFRIVADQLVDMGFDGVDINMGCPDKSVVKNGTGGGMIKYPDHALEVIRATREGLAGRVPLSVKTRIGFNEYDEAWLRAILGEKLNMLSIHFRTVKEMSKVPAHWELAGRVRELRDELSPDTLLVGNGDVQSYEQAVTLANEYGYDGVMIGRGIFLDPFVFAKESPWPELTPFSKVEIFKRHVRLFRETWQDGERPIAPLNKFCKIYVNDFPGAKEYRVRLMSCASAEELESVVDQILGELK